jgi:hypothetical protein
VLGIVSVHVLVSVVLGVVKVQVQV